MIPQVTNLDGTPATNIIKGNTYLVPCVFGIPVICPSHVDEGSEGPTGRHWHTDSRWGSLNRPIDYYTGPVRDSLPDLGPGHTVGTSIIKDDGQPIDMLKMVAQEYCISPSGAVYSSLVWLYHHYGHLHANEGYCVHHRTPLIHNDFKGEGCLTCPAHGMKYNADGSPKYKAPFYIAVRYIDKNNKIRRIKQPVSFMPDPVTFNIYGRFDPFPLFALEDSVGEVIITERISKKCCEESDDPDHLTLIYKIAPWPASGECIQLKKEDPR